MSEEQDKLDRILENSEDSAVYARRAGAGWLGKLTATPANTAITVLFIMLAFIVIAALIATNNDELLLQLFGMIDGG